MLLERQGVRVPYRRLHRLCAERRGFAVRRRRSGVRTGQMGSECRLDFGYMGTLLEPVSSSRSA